MSKRSFLPDAELGVIFLQQMMDAFNSTLDFNHFNDFNHFDNYRVIADASDPSGFLT